MIPARKLIKEALDDEEGRRRNTQFIREYYKELVYRADMHKRVVQTNRDETLSRYTEEIVKKFGDK